MKNVYMTKTAYSMICGLCIALSAAVQTVFSSFGADCALYLSVLICTVCCPLRYGICCALICPVISMMCAGSPAVVLLPAGAAKCLIFVLITRFLLGKFSTGRIFSDLYISLVPAVCVAQITGAVISSAIFCGDVNSAVMFAATEIIAAIPETVILLAILPATVEMLRTLDITDERLFSGKNKIKTD